MKTNSIALIGTEGHCEVMAAGARGTQVPARGTPLVETLSGLFAGRAWARRARSAKAEPDASSQARTAVQFLRDEMEAESRVEGWLFAGLGLASLGLLIGNLSAGIDLLRGWAEFSAFVARCL